MAESVAKKLSPKEWEIRSAGSTPSKEVNARILEVLKSAGYETNGLFPKFWDSFEPSFFINLDYIIRVCDGDFCPTLFSKDTKVLDWPMDDPVMSESLEAYRETLNIFEDKWANFLKEVLNK